MITLDGRIYKQTIGTKRYYRVMAYSDTTLQLPVRITDIPGMEPTDGFAAGSTIYVIANGTPSKVYICDSTENFIPQ